MVPWTVELERVDWNAYACWCGERGHLADDLRQIITARSVAEMGAASLDGHVEDQGMLADVAVPAAGVIMAALHEDLGADARSELIITLWRCVLGAEDESGRAAIQQQVRAGIWAIYREATHGDTETALDILECVEQDTARLDAFREAVRSRLDKRRRRRQAPTGWGGGREGR
ncbi:hypothetical protein [Streptomyces sp. cg36]|uniref:hypothetical protein n=1 Tax=Streptomyces sp. cg36 TaxID=3238798 RepID=UPI0034E2B002